MNLVVGKMYVCRHLVTAWEECNAAGRNVHLPRESLVVVVNVRVSRSMTTLKVRLLTSTGDVVSTTFEPQNLEYWFEEAQGC